MSQVIYLSDYQTKARGNIPGAQGSLMPVDIALGEADQQQCLITLERHGMDTLERFQPNESTGSVTYLVEIEDAISVNKTILESEGLTEAEEIRCIDLIQMLENIAASDSGSEAMQTTDIGSKAWRE